MIHQKHQAMECSDEVVQAENVLPFPEDAVAFGEACAFWQDTHNTQSTLSELLLLGLTQMAHFVWSVQQG